MRCPACPLATGAFKRTRNGEDGGWAHVTCTLYHQNMGFDKPKTMDVAAGYQYVPEGLKKLKCSL